MKLRKIKIGICFIKIQARFVKIDAYQCKLCGLALNNQFELDEHIPLHDNFGALQCVVCLQTKATKYILFQHTRLHVIS